MIYQIKVQLQGVTKPPVWRRILIPNDATFSNLHKAIQKAFGWQDSHTYAFSQNPNDGGWNVSDSKSSSVTASAKDTAIKEYLNGRCPKITYVYDPSDDWVHVITLEDKDVKGCEDKEHAHCTGGNGCCPPEDCGGVAGYKQIKAFAEENPQRAIKAAKGAETKEEIKKGFKNPSDQEACEMIRKAGLFFEITDRKPDFSVIDIENLDNAVSKIKLTLTSAKAKTTTKTTTTTKSSTTTKSTASTKSTTSTKSTSTAKKSTSTTKKETGTAKKTTTTAKKSTTTTAKKSTTSTTKKPSTSKTGTGKKINTADKKDLEKIAVEILKGIFGGK